MESEMFLMFIFMFTAFGAIVYTIKALIDTRMRNKLIASNPSDALIQALLVDEKRLRRHAGLRWGIVLSCLAVGFIVIDIVGWDDITPGAFGVLLGATGIGNLVVYAIERWAAQDGQDRR